MKTKLLSSAIMPVCTSSGSIDLTAITTRLSNLELDLANPAGEYPNYCKDFDYDIDGNLIKILIYSDHNRLLLLYTIDFYYINGNLIKKIITRLEDTKILEVFLDYTNDNLESICHNVVMPEGPEIIDINIVQSYPGIQTEVKENDSISINIKFDPLGTAPNDVMIYTYGAAKGKSIIATDYGLQWGTIHEITVPVSVAYTGNTPTLKTVKASAKNNFGTEGETKESISTILCCDLKPSFSSPSILYPIDQLALKDTEQATVSLTITNFTSAQYLSPNGDLLISNNEEYNQSKLVTCNAGHIYNATNVNYKVTAVRSNNNTSAIYSMIVEIANISPIVTITQPEVRLRSDVLGKNHVITATSNQNMLLLPLISINIPVSGTWQGTSFASVNSKTFTRTIIIHDFDTPGILPWSFVSTPKNRAGIEATIIGNQNVGGFLPRLITIAPWPNRECHITAKVSNSAKLVCENLTKGGGGPNGGMYFTYSESIINEPDKFTLTDPSGIANTNGNTWYNKDLSNAVINTSGTAQINIEETS